MLLVIGYIALGVFWHFNQSLYIWSTLPVVAFFGGWGLFILSMLVNSFRNRPAVGGGGNMGLAADDVGVIFQVLLIFGVTGATVLTHFI